MVKKQSIQSVPPTLVLGRRNELLQAQTTIERLQGQADDNFLSLQNALAQQSGFLKLIAKRETTDAAPHTKEERVLDILKARSKGLAEEIETLLAQRQAFLAELDAAYASYRSSYWPNGATVAETETAESQLGDETASEASMLPQHTLAFSHISFRYPGANRLVLDDLSLSVRTREITAILGVSGAGKTTLADILSNKKTSQAPDFSAWFDGQAVRPDSLRWGAAPQANLIREHWRVTETFRYFAAIHLEDQAAAVKASRIQAIQEALELTELLKRKVRALSGGQKRRVSIGVELLSNANFFVLDEPFSGLDVITSMRLLRMLKNFAKREDKAFVVVTHNTENLAFFDNLIFLAKGHKKFEGTFDDLLSKNSRVTESERRLYQHFSIAETYEQINQTKDGDE